MPVARIASSAPRSMKGPKQMTLRRLIRRAGNARLTSGSGYLLNDGYADRHCRFHWFNTFPAGHASGRTFTCPATRISTRPVSNNR